MAARSLLAHGHTVYAVGVRPGRIGEIEIHTDVPEHMWFRTATIYLNAVNQRMWQDRLLALRPARIIFNPGAENVPFAAAARSVGIEVVEGCTLVMLSAGTF